MTVALSFERFRTRLGVDYFPSFPVETLTSSHVNLLLVRSHQGEIFNVKRLINNVTRVRVESRSCDHGRRKNDALTLSATPPTRYFTLLKLLVSNRSAPYCLRPRGGLRDNGARTDKSAGPLNYGRRKQLTSFWILNLIDITYQPEII